MRFLDVSVQLVSLLVIEGTKKLNVQAIIQSLQQAQHVRRRIMQLDPRAAAYELGVRRLGKREEITENLRMTLELATVDLKRNSRGDDYNISV